jgi:hypothetical protein
VREGESWRWVGLLDLRAFCCNIHIQTHSRQTVTHVCGSLSNGRKRGTKGLLREEMIS